VAVHSYKFGVALLAALKSDPTFESLREDAAIDRLVGTKKLREAIDKGEPVDAIVAQAQGPPEVTPILIFPRAVGPLLHNYG
jgi:hypothetical protein